MNNYCIYTSQDIPCCLALIALVMEGLHKQIDDSDCFRGIHELDWLEALSPLQWRICFPYICRGFILSNIFIIVHNVLKNSRVLLLFICFLSQNLAVLSQVAHADTADMSLSVTSKKNLLVSFQDKICRWGYLEQIGIKN